ncbi:MAG: hypothetical protein WDW36_004241 [Sanguina aurantia]
MVISDTQAAKVSANRTAAFARTGDYSSEEEEDADEEGGYAAAATNRRKRAAVPAPPVQRPAGVRSAVSGDDDAHAPSHPPTLDPALQQQQQQHLPISALSIPQAGASFLPAPAPAPRSSPAPLPALPTHRDPHDFATYSRPNPTTTTNNNSVNHSVNHHSSATHSQSAYPQLNNNNNNNNNNSSSSYPSIVPIPDYLLPFSTPSLSLSLEDPLLQPLNHHSQQQQQQQQQRQQDESHPPFQGGALFSHQQPHHPLLPHAHTLSHQQSPYGASHLHPALASNSTQQPHPYTAGNSGYGTHSHPQQQLPHGGPTLQQPQPRYLPTLTQDVDAFSSGHMQQQLQGGCLWPMYPSSSSASVSGSYPATAMPASFTTGMPALFPTITSAPFNTSSLHSMPHPARPAVPHQQQQPLHRLSEPQLNPQQAPSPQPDVKHEQPGPSSSQPNPPHTSTGPLLAPAFTSTGVTLPDDSSDYANSHPASADNKYNHQETHNGGRRWPQRERRPRRSCKRARPVDW